ncbi:MAG: hypothetical protein WCL02_08335 [bacterium]
MTFSLNGIKQDKDEKYTVEMLVCVDAPLLARKILEQRNILILSLKEFSQDKKMFGDIYFTIKLNYQEIDIVTRYENIQEACTFFSFIGFDIIAINSYTTPIPSKIMQDIISKAKIEVEEKQSKIREQREKKQAQEKKVYKDEQLESAKKVIIRVFEKVEETIKRSAGSIAIQDMKKLKSLTEELRKLRMGTNFEKIRETIQDIFTIIEKINAVWYAGIQNPDSMISSNTVITTPDVDKELDILENIKILKSLHARIAVKKQDYAIFGTSAMFWKFLQKDFLYTFNDSTVLLYNLYDIVEFVVLIIATLLGVYTLANELFLFSTSQL